MNKYTENWQEFILKDFVELNPKESLKKGITTKKIPMELLMPFCRDITTYEISKYSGGTKFKNDDTIMARITPCLENGKRARVSILDNNEIAFGSTEYIVFRARKGISDANFVYYLVCSDLIRKPAIKSMVGSSGRQRVQTDVIENLEFHVPPLPIQKKIAAVLSALDDKIELNNKVNQNLEQQAQAIFKSWFVDFEPFGGKMPDDWKIKKLSECTNQIIRGFTSKYVEKSNLINLNQKVNKGNILEKQYYKYLDERFEVPKEKFAHKKDILLNSLGQGTLGRIHFWNENDKNIVIDQHITIVRAKKEVTTAEYLYLLLSSSKYKEHFENCITGTTGMLMLNISVVRDTEITLPTFSIQTQFSNIASSLYEMIEQNNQETARLAQLRDTLLPKLMSGEIDVSRVK